MICRLQFDIPIAVAAASFQFLLIFVTPSGCGKFFISSYLDHFVSCSVIAQLIAEVVSVFTVCHAIHMDRGKMLEHFV